MILEWFIIEAIAQLIKLVYIMHMWIACAFEPLLSIAHYLFYPFTYWRALGHFQVWATMNKPSVPI